MPAVPLFRDTNMAAVMSRENTLLVRKIGNPSSRENVAMTSSYEPPWSVHTLGEGRLNAACDFGCSHLTRFIYLLRSLSHQN